MAPQQQPPIVQAPEDPWSGEDASQDGYYTSGASDGEVDDGRGDDNNNDTESIHSLPVNPNSKSDERAQYFKKIFYKLHGVYPNRFKVTDSVVPYYKSMSRSNRGDLPVPHLLLDPELKGSWLNPPDKYRGGDTVTYFANIQNIIPRVSRFTLKNFTLAAKSPCPYLDISDKSLKKFLKAEPIKKVDLDHTLFDKSSIDVGSTPQSQIDAILRKALTDSLVNDELFKIIFDLAGSFVTRIGPQDPLSPNLDSLFSTLEISAENNQRSGQAILAALVCNKLYLRDHVLKRFSVPEVSRSLLRGSDFKSDKLFGPLPESFRETLLHPMGNVYKCSSRNKGSAPNSRPFKSSNSTFNKKRSSSSAVSDPKRFRSSGSGASSQAQTQNFRTKFRRKK